MNENTRPLLIASWDERAISAVIDDHEWVGGKAVGLFKIPSKWVPPFIVLTKGFYALAKANGIETALSRLNPKESDIYAEFISGTYPRMKGGHLFIRSNAPSEDLRCRGAYESFLVEANSVGINNAIFNVINEDGVNPMCVILHHAVNPCLGFHVSNERRLTSKKNMWLVEGLEGVQNSKKIYIQASSSPPLGSLGATNDAQLKKRLRELFGFMGNIGGGRFHLELAWDTRQLWVVQADEEKEVAIDPGISEYLSRVSCERASSPLCYTAQHFSKIDAKKWKKLRRPHLFHGLDFPTANVYVFSGNDWEIPDKRLGLIYDIESMCELCDVVVRCDISSESSKDETLLPTSSPSRHAKKVCEFIEKASYELRGRGIPKEQFSFLLSGLVKTRASAMALANPKAQIVQVDALWGFPDGLLHMPHDTFFVATNNWGIPKKQIRHKGYGWFAREGEWGAEVLSSDFDWKKTLNDEEVVICAQWALALANKLGRQVQLMCFARIDGKRGAKACLPWHYTDWDVPNYRTSLVSCPREIEAPIIRCYEDLETMRQKGHSTNIRGYTVRPASTLLRDSDFLVKVSEFATAQKKPLFFEGSLLGHAYYLMSQAGAVVVPISAVDTVKNRIIYNKLVRDNIPVIIEKAGGLKRIVKVDKSQAKSLLTQKLIEEAFEVFQAESDGELAEELADVLEVVKAIAKQLDIDLEEIEAIRRDKEVRSGGFEELIVLKETTSKTLKSDDTPEGHLPLFPGLPSVNIGEGDHSSRLDVQIARGAKTKARFKLSLIPPVSADGGTFIDEVQGQLTFFVKYLGDEVLVEVSSREVDKKTDQYSLMKYL